MNTNWAAREPRMARITRMLREALFEFGVVRAELLALNYGLETRREPGA
jgi:hypothetical protein